MTESEFTASLQSGSMKIEEPSSDEETKTTGEGELSLAQFIPILTLLQSTQLYLSAAPTFIPQTFQDQFQFVFDGTHYYLYVYFNKAWQKVTLNNTSIVSQIIPGAGISISPSGGTGNVTITNTITQPTYSQVSSGSFYLYQDTASASITSSTATKVHELQFPAGMPTSTFAVTFSITGGATGSPNQQYNGQIYKNGVAYGSVHTATPNTSSYSTFTDNLTFAAGDKCELYVWWSGTNLAAGAYNNFGLLGIPIPTYLIPTKLS